MSRLTFYSVVLCFVITGGCARDVRQVEVTLDNIWDIDPAQVREVTIDSPLRRHSMLRDNRYVITDRKKIGVVLRCIRQMSYPVPPRAASRFIRFRTSRVVYATPIDWDDRSVYGRDWESLWLWQYFHRWGLFEAIAAADPQWPPPTYLMHPAAPPDPIPESDPNDAQSEAGVHEEQEQP